MSIERVDPNELGDEAEFVEDAIDDEVDDEVEAGDRLQLDRKEVRDNELDSDEVEADELLLLDRKELSELGSELDNPDGFADE